jgi:hypothetical protein
MVACAAGRCGRADGGLTRDVGVVGERRHNMSARDVAELRVEDEDIAVIFIKKPV